MCITHDQQELQDHMSDEFIDHLQMLKEIEDKESLLFQIEFYIGNRHELIKEPYK